MKRMPRNVPSRYKFEWIEEKKEYRCKKRFRYTDVNGKITQNFEPEIVRNVISEQTSELMRGLMERVVAEGTGKQLLEDDTMAEAYLG